MDVAVWLGQLPAASGTCRSSRRRNENVIRKDRCEQTRESRLRGFLLLLVLSVIGVGITDYSPADAHHYWVFIVLAR